MTDDNKKPDDKAQSIPSSVNSDAKPVEQDDGGPPYYVQYVVWEKGESAYTDNGPTRRDSHTGERKTFEGVFGEDTPLDCVNAILYEMRGSKSHYELAYIDEITPLAEKERNNHD